jgi:hypothetical protein
MREGGDVRHNTNTLLIVACGWRLCACLPHSPPPPPPSLTHNHCRHHHYRHHHDTNHQFPKKRHPPPPLLTTHPLPTTPKPLLTLRYICADSELKHYVKRSKADLHEAVVRARQSRPHMIETWTDYVSLIINFNQRKSISISHMIKCQGLAFNVVFMCVFV